MVPPFILNIVVNDHLTLTWSDLVLSTNVPQWHSASSVCATRFTFAGMIAGIKLLVKTYLG